MPNLSMIIPWSLTGILLFLLVIIFLNPDKAKIWSSWVLGWFASLHSFFARKAVSGRVEGVINQFANEFDKEGYGIMPYNLKIDWVKDIDREALLKEEGIVLVRMGYQRRDIGKSLVAAMLTFCSKALIPAARPYLSTGLLRSVDLTTTKRMLTRSKSRSSLDYFLGDVLRPEIEADENLCSQCQTMERLDDRGLYSRVLLRELQEFGLSLYPKTPDGLTVSEGSDFVSFLKKIAEKAPDEDVELTFIKSRIRIAIILVARREVIEEHGYPPYLKRIEQKKKAGLERIYLCGLGVNTLPARRIAEIAEKKGLGTIVSCDNHKVLSLRGKTIPAVCIVLILNSSSSSP